MNSSDGTFQESKVGDGRVRSFDLKTKASGKAIALNYGIEQSRGKYIMIIDADTILEDNFIENAMPALSDDSLAAVQGRVFPINRGYNFLTEAHGHGRRFMARAYYDYEECVGRTVSATWVRFHS